MPLYTYRCEHCQRSLEVLHKVSEPAPSHCPDCNGPLVKGLTAAGFQLKGSGWYATDFKDKKPAAKSSDSTGDSPAPASSAAASPTPTPSSEA